MNNYKVTVREVREWTFLIGAGSALEAAVLGKLKAVCSEKPHETWFEDPVAYEVKHIPLTYEHNQEQQ